MFVRLDRGLDRERRRIAVLLALVALSGAVVLAHGALAGHHMDDEAVTLCVAVAQTAALGVAVLIARKAPPAIRWTWPATPAPALVAAAPRRVAAPASRAGPAVLQVFLR